jgi:hypothetical protein
MAIKQVEIVLAKDQATILGFLKTSIHADNEFSFLIRDPGGVSSLLLTCKEWEEIKVVVDQALVDYRGEKKKELAA